MSAVRFRLEARSFQTPIGGKMIKKIIAVVGIASMSFLAAAPVGAVQQNTVATASKDYSTAKKNQFWRLVTKYDPMVKYAGKQNAINLGVAVCDLLRAGGDITDVAKVLMTVEEGVVRDVSTVIVASAPVVLCPDQAYKFK